ncbi:relaxase/mobilization nuclease domain-containing protein [Gemmiger formicilis]|uniref:relaxase/mobilization nuclease domain-containing protein n=1 Tax=Gemmiger formicilis TaxID=745368 RepID=UPI0039948B56
MAITKIHAIKSTLGKALAYIENPDKTDGQMLVSGYNCEPQTASIDFEMTAVLEHKARNLKRKRSTNLAYHLIQSFSPEDAVTPEQAHELGKAIRLHRGQNTKRGCCTRKKSECSSLFTLKCLQKRKNARHRPPTFQKADNSNRPF